MQVIGKALNYIRITSGELTIKLSSSTQKFTITMATRLLEFWYKLVVSQRCDFRIKKALNVRTAILGRMKVQDGVFQVERQLSSTLKIVTRSSLKPCFINI